MTSQIRNIGALISVMNAAANTAATAGGTGDATEVVGLIIDRTLIGLPQSAVFAIPFAAVLAEGETLSLAYTIESSGADDMSGAVDLLTGAATVVATGPTGGGTVRGCYEVAVPLMGAGQYVRGNFTPDLSSANTDTAALSAVFVFGGMDRLPQ